MAEREKLVDNNERDWSNLPADIVHLIAKKLPDIFEFVYFRAVCKSWRSSAPLSDPPPQMPWLLQLPDYIYTYDPFDPEITQLQYYSITSGKTVTVPINKYQWLQGVSCHYLPSYDDHEDIISLFNPLTRREIVYPPICTSPHSLHSPWIVWTDRSPICDRNIMIVDRDIYRNQIGCWVFYDAQHKAWTKEEGFFDYFCYCQGKFFSANYNFETKVTDISSKKLLYTIPPPEDGYHKLWSLWVRRPAHLVESSGEILAVCVPQHQEKESVFDIHRLDYGGEDGQPRWVRISDIGDRILFLEERSGFSITAAPSTTGFRRGCIYLIKPNSRELYVYHVATGSMEKVPCPFKNCTWFLPGLN